MAAVRRFARAFGLKVIDVSRVRHEVVLEGTWRAVGKAFRVELRYFRHAHGVYRAHAGLVHVPEEIRDAVDCILGLDDIPLVRGHKNCWHVGRAAPPPIFTPLEVARHYRFPPSTTGKGQRIALIEFGGGFHPSDIHTFFHQLGMTPPRITERSLPGIRNHPLRYALLEEMVAALRSDPQQAYGRYQAHLSDLVNTLEVTMDVEIAGSLAPDAELCVVFAPPTAQAWRAALYRAMEDPQASIIAISWGNAECTLSASAVHGINEALSAARLRQITVCCSSGDFGSRGTPPGAETNGCANVAFPASSPYVLACGGTALAHAGDRITGESVWNCKSSLGRFASGGGVSGLFRIADYQGQSGVPAPQSLRPRKTWLARGTASERSFRGRGVPDVAANAGTLSAYRIVLGGQTYSGSGTSAAAPLWAALVARLNESLGFPLGWANPLFYESSAALTFRSITHGDNNVRAGKTAAYYRASRGWNACTGLGAPDGVRLLRALRTLCR